MYGPIANLPGYNPNATYLPPGMAAPSSYPERTAPRQQFYDMAPLPSVVDQSVMDLAGSGLSSADPYDSAFGPTGIAGGIGGPDALEYAFLNFLAQSAQPQPQPQPQMVPPNFSGPSNDQYSGDYLVQPNFGGPQPWDFGNFGNFSQPQQTRVTAQEDGQGVITGQPGTWDYGQPSWPQDYYQSSIPLQPFDIQPSGLTQSQLDQLGRLPSLDQGIGAGWNTAANLAGLALPGFGGMALNALYGLGTGLAGETLTSDPDKSFLGRMLDPREPGLIASGLNYAGRAINDMLSPAERSAEDAYGRSDVYNKDGSGWQMGAPAYSATPVDNTWSGNNPAAWGFNAEPWAGDFGAGRYDAGFTPSEWQINQGIIDNWAPQTYQLPMSPIMPIDPGASWFAPPELGNWADDELPMFGPGGRYGTGRWSTD